MGVYNECILFFMVNVFWVHGYATGRFSNGRNNNPTIAQKYALLSLEKQLPRDVRQEGGKVFLSVAAYRILEVDVMSEEFALEMEVQYKWNDKESARNNIMNESDLPWTPELWSFSPVTTFGAELLVLDPSTGTYYLTKSYVIVAKFTMDITLYPFDKHVLKLSLFFNVPQQHAVFGGVLDERTDLSPEARMAGSSTGYYTGPPKSQEADDVVSGWLVNWLVRKAFYYCFPVLTAADDQRNVHLYEIVIQTDVPDNTTDYISMGCAQAHRVGLEMSLEIARRSGLIFTLVLPSSFVCMFSMLQMYIDTKYFGARNQIPTIGLMSITTLMVQVSVPITGTVSWFEVYSFIIVGHIAAIIALNVWVHRVHLGNRESRSRLYDKVAGLLLPYHLCILQGCVAGGFFFPPNLVPLWVILYIFLMIPALVFSFGWLARAFTRPRMLVETYLAEKKQHARNNRAKAVIETTHSTEKMMEELRSPLTRSETGDDDYEEQSDISSDSNQTFKSTATSEQFMPDEDRDTDPGAADSPTRKKDRKKRLSMASESSDVPDFTLTDSVTKSEMSRGSTSDGASSKHSTSRRHHHKKNRHHDDSHERKRKSRSRSSSDHSLKRTHSKRKHKRRERSHSSRSNEEGKLERKHGGKLRRTSSRGKSSSSRKARAVSTKSTDDTAAGPLGLHRVSNLPVRRGGGIANIIAQLNLYDDDEDLDDDV